MTNHTQKDTPFLHGNSDSIDIPHRSRLHKLLQRVYPSWDFLLQMDPVHGPENFLPKERPHILQENWWAAFRKDSVSLRVHRLSHSRLRGQAARPAGWHPPHLSN